MGYLEEMMAAAKKKKEAPEAVLTEKEKKQALKIGAPGLEEEAGAESQLIGVSGQARVYKVPGENLPVYITPLPDFTEDDKNLLTIIREAAARIIHKGIEDFKTKQEMKGYYYKNVRDIILSSPELGIPKNKIDLFTEAVVREMTGYGLLDILLEDDGLEEVMVIGTAKPVYVFHRKYGMLKTNVKFLTNEEAKAVVDRIAREVGRRVDMQSPLLDARLVDGSRVNATIPPISLDGPTITIRKFRADPYTVVDLLNYRTLDSQLAAFLWLAVDGMGVKPANILIAGGTGSGKTTTLNTLASFIPPQERVLSIEDTAELNLPLNHWIRLESRPPSMEGTGEISLDLLVKNSLRMRPDRVLVGEIRHKEAFTLFTAMNTGHDGCMGTLHANSSEETLVRVTNPPMNVPNIMVGALDFILIQQRINSRKFGIIRRIVQFSEVYTDAHGSPSIRDIFLWQPTTDTIKRVFPSSDFQKTVQEYTAFSDEEFAQILVGRQEALEDLRKEGVRDLTGVKKRLVEHVKKERIKFKK